MSRKEAVEVGLAHIGNNHGSFTQELPILAVRKYLQQDLERLRQYRFLPFYAIYTVLLTSIIFGHRVDFSDNAPQYFVNERANDIMQMSQFTSIASKQDAWQWIRGAAKGIHEVVERNDEDSSRPFKYIRGDDVNRYNTTAKVLPLGMMILRQHRVYRSSCMQATMDVITPLSNSELRKNCFGQYGTDHLSATPYGPGGRWISNDMNNFSVRLMAVDGLFRPYDNHDYEFQQAFYYKNPLLKTSKLNFTLMEIDGLEATGWIDDATRMVSLDTIWYHQAEDIFNVKANLIEVTPTGVFSKKQVSIIFTLFRLGSLRSYAIFVLDAFVGVLTLLYLGDTCKVIYVNYRVFGRASKCFGFQEFTSLVVIGLIAVAEGHRAGLWYRGIMFDPHLYDNHYPDDASRLMTSFLSRTAADIELSYTLFSVGFGTSVVKLFYYLQYNSKLNLLTETIKVASGELLGVAIITIALIVPFGAIGNVFYGHFEDNFRSFGRAFSYLTRVLISAEIYTWDAMYESHPNVTVIFWGAFFLLCWLIILNMVLGIIAGSFHTVQEEMPPELKKTFLEDLREVGSMVFGVGVRFRSDRHLSDNYRCRSMSASIKAAQAGLSTPIPWTERMTMLRDEFEKRIHAVHVMTELTRKRRQAYVTVEQICVVLPFYSPAEVEEIFENSRRRMANAAQSKSLVARRQEQLDAKIDSMSRDMAVMRRFEEHFEGIEGVWTYISQLSSKTTLVHEELLAVRRQLGTLHVDTREHQLKDEARRKLKAKGKQQVVGLQADPGGVPSSRGPSSGTPVSPDEVEADLNASVAAARRTPPLPEYDEGQRVSTVRQLEMPEQVPSRHYAATSTQTDEEPGIATVSQVAAAVPCVEVEQTQSQHRDAVVQALEDKVATMSEVLLRIEAMLHQKTTATPTTLVVPLPGPSRVAEHDAEPQDSSGVAHAAVSEVSSISGVSIDVPPHAGQEELDSGNNPPSPSISGHQADDE